MDKSIRKIYDMMYSPIITPYNLLENAKVDNYNYVKYYKSDDGLISEMECEIESEKTIFYYYFDSKDFLQKIYMDVNGEKDILFTREDAIDDAKQEYYQKKPNCKVAI